MKNLEAYKQVAHFPSLRWADRLKAAKETELYEQALEMVKENNKAKESPFVWIDWDTWKSIEAKQANRPGQKKVDTSRQPLRISN